MTYVSRAVFHVARAAPVTAVTSAQDGQSYLVTTLDSNVRLMDAATGKMLNGFKGHKAEGYRCRSCFGHGEASVICGDESGTIWAWDLLDVSPFVGSSSVRIKVYP